MHNIRFLLMTILLWTCTAAVAAPAPRITQVFLSPGDGENVLVPQLTIQSDPGVTNLVLYSSTLNQPNWEILTNLLVTETPYSVVDAGAPSSTTRFYRVLALFPLSPPGTAHIAAGAFVMGNPLESTYPEELPLHTVHLSAFCADAKLVTKALWDEVCQWAIDHDYEIESPGFGKDTDHPVVEVSWYDALKWCNARSEKESLEPAYWTDSSQTAVFRSGQIDLDSASVKWNAGYRLPTEAEWEKAARGGADGYNYPWHDSNQFFHTRANVIQNPIFDTGEYPHTSPVAYFPPNDYGLYDMAGNVWEWCWDWYNQTWYSNPAASADDTRGPDSGDYRVLRGGSWNDDFTHARCAKRGFDGASASFNAYGFRCVKGP
ncbi:MAG TPA: SUMF1/EgtB/PvdO family nonheme iron enzyme [Verrucomicrobiota bacterium]|jgi:formylglycine-generating enzyme required for sulfatase activity|nr:SUMF1/EgtB/PvdO family nonheme iron enzyme [Verrucomicrobiota bacterium]HQL77632.1 SUMF1/EgtB/PvdO family nonheme iron enzyme [Verrucomicrobiota bacterium]